MILKIIAKILIVTVVAAFALWGIGLYDFYKQIPVTATTDNEKTDAIIVLTGGQERIAEGIKLLNHNYAPKLLISGVAREAKMEQLLEQQHLPKDEAKQVDFSKIKMGREAVNTVGNALETADWVKANNIKSIRLVTANYHMPRALVEFKKQMPDLKIIENPVFPENFQRNYWQEDQFTRRLIVIEYIKYLMAQIGK